MKMKITILKIMKKIWKIIIVKMIMKVITMWKNNINDNNENEQWQ